MNSHQQKVLKFRLSYEAGHMTKKEVDMRISLLGEEDWVSHLKMQKPDGSCRPSCPLHGKTK